MKKEKQLYIDQISSGLSTPCSKVSSILLALEIKKRIPVTYFTSGDSVVEHLKKTASPDDLIVTMGAGDVWKTGEAFLEKNNC